MKSTSVRTMFISIFITVATAAVPLLAEAQVQDCSTLTSRQETFNGKTYTKYNILDFSYNQCPKS